MKEHIQDKRYFILVEFFYWFAMACFNYLTVFLEAQGFAQVQVGLLNTVASVVAVFSSPLGGTIADRLQSSRKALMLYTMGFSIVYFFIPLAASVKFYGVIILVILVTIAQFFRAPTQSLLETTVIAGCQKTNLDYGRIRVFGTISYVIMSLMLGLLITKENAQITFYLLAILFVPCLGYLFKLGQYDDVHHHKKILSLKDLPYDQLFKNPYFIAYFIFSLFNYIPQMASMSFQPYILKAVGVNMGYVGIIQAYRACFEIPTLLLSQKIEKKISYRTMVLLSAIFMAIQFILYGKVKSFGSVLLATTFAGIASGFSIAGAFKYVFTIAPEQLVSTAQTIIATTMSIAGILGNMLGTLLIARMSVQHLFAIMGVIMLVNVVVYLMWLWFQERASS